MDRRGLDKRGLWTGKYYGQARAGGARDMDRRVLWIGKGWIGEGYGQARAG